MKRKIIVLTALILCAAGSHRLLPGTDSGMPPIGISPNQSDMPIIRDVLPETNTLDLDSGGYVSTSRPRSAAAPSHVIEDTGRLHPVINRAMKMEMYSELDGEVMDGLQREGVKMEQVQALRMRLLDAPADGSVWSGFRDGCGAPDP